MGDRARTIEAPWKDPGPGHTVEGGASPVLWAERSQYIELPAMSKVTTSVAGAHRLELTATGTCFFSRKEGR